MGAIRPGVMSLVAAGVFAAAACGDGDGDVPGTGTAAPTASVTATVPGTVIPDGLGAQLIADLARRLGVPPGQVSVASFRRVTWPDGCLGVYRPDAVCTQALVEGWLAVLRDGSGKEYRYHGGDGHVLAASFEAGARIGEPLR